MWNPTQEKTKQADSMKSLYGLSMVSLYKFKPYLRYIFINLPGISVLEFSNAHVAFKSPGSVGGWRITDLSIGCCRDAPSHIHMSCNITQSH